MRGIDVDNFGSAFIAALALGLANLLIKPILSIIVAPINWLTFGIFAFLFAIVINGFLLKLVAEFIDGFRVKDWLSAIIGSIVISFISSVLHTVLL
jgi:putative membrane protein